MAAPDRGLALGGHWSVSVLPEFYGLLAFAQASPAGSRLVPIGGALPSGLQADGTVTASGSVHVVLVNTSTAARTVTLDAAGATGPGTVSL